MYFQIGIYKTYLYIILGKPNDVNFYFNFNLSQSLFLFSLEKINY